MPSKTDFNVSPYYDDFDKDKNFHRVMYRPGFAVQARELTTQQSILQNQIEQMGDHMFKHGAMVIPGNIHYDANWEGIALTSFTGTLANFKDTKITGGTTGVTAQVLAVEGASGDIKDTLSVKYLSAGTDNATHLMGLEETITSDSGTGETAVVSSTQEGSAVHVEAGTYYINGYFVDVDAQTIVLDPYSRNTSYRVGFNITETFITSTDDTSLLDNAQGSSNENATGAHRLKITLTLAKYELDSVVDSSFVELMRINGGEVVKQVEHTTYNIVEDTLARRTYDESGDYVVRPYDIDIRENLKTATNNGVYAATDVTVQNHAPSEDMLAVGFSQGKAYVRGYEVSNLGVSFIDLDKARDFDTVSGAITRFAQLPFVNVTNIHGTPDIGFVTGETETFKKVRLVDEEHSTRGTVLTNNDGTVQDIGRAKSRGIEYHSGSASGVFMSSAALKTNTYKHYLFDTVMFAHLNVSGAASGALTTGETLTGGSSGATAIVESITSLGTATITGVTAAQPPVVTMSGGHNFKEGQQIVIASAAGMTQINTTHTVKNPTATTLELFEASTSSNSKPSAVNGTGYSAWTSGGTVAHTIVVLSDVKREFIEGETCTGSSSSETVVVQFNAYGCQGFEQKEFSQTKGISMAGSPPYTADVDLTSTFGDVKTLTGTISTVDPDASSGSIVMDGSDANGTDENGSIILEDATETGSAVTAIGLEDPADQEDVLIGSGTRFLSDLKVGDQITFEDDSNTTVTRIVQSIHSNNKLETSIGLGTTSATSKIFKRQRTKIQSPENDRALFKLPYEVVKTLLTTTNSGVSDTSFKIRRQFVTTLSSSGTATLTAGTNEVFTSHSEADVTVSVMTKGGSATAGEVGDVITLSGSGDYTLGGSPTGKTLAIDLGSTFNGSKIKVLATISGSVVSAKTKTNTDTTTTVNTAALSGLTQINLGKADVHTITSVHMAADFDTAATTDDDDITSRFTLDTGQRDNYYDVGRLVRKAGQPAPTGRLLITFSYFEHGAGNFFSVDSYAGFDYGSIPTYTSDISGEEFRLYECLDFRPRVDNDSTINAGDGQDRQYSGTGGSAIEVAKINSDITADLEFYLARKDRIYLTKTGDISFVRGEPDINPILPKTLEDAMLLYNLFLPPFTFNPSDVKITQIDNRRFTMRDIGKLEKRIENVEFYTQLSLLEAEAQNMQIQDADGFDRFKNGIIVDNFTGHGIADVSDNDYSVSMDMGQGEMRPAFSQDNIAFKEIDADISTPITEQLRSDNGYFKNGDLLTLPYDSHSYIEQPYASTTVNLNPFEIVPFVGRMELDPPIDEWMDTTKQPDLVVDLPGSYDTLTNLASEGVLKLNMGTVWNNWNDYWSGAVKEVNREVDSTINGNVLKTTTTIDTEQRVKQRRSGIRTALVPNTIKNNLGDRVTSIAFVPFIRAKDVEFTAKGLKPNSRFYAFFDTVAVSEYVTPTGSSKGAALTSDANGTCTGTFSIPDPNVTTNPRWRTGIRPFRLTTNSVNSIQGDVFSSAETDYTAKGLMNTIQGTITSTREPKVQRTNHDETKEIVRKDKSVSSYDVVLDTPGGGSNSGNSGQGGNDSPHITYTTEWVPNGPPGSGLGTKITKQHINGVVTNATTTGYNHGVASGSYRNGNHHPGTERNTKVTFRANEIPKSTSSRTYAPNRSGSSPGHRRSPPRRRSCGPPGRDPVAQSFTVDTQGGIFVTSIDLFFSNKSATAPVTMQLRTMYQGHPTQKVIPFGEVTLDAADINTSTDASVATTFTFPSPVYLQDGVEYCFTMPCSTTDCTIYTARMGQKTLDGSRLISKQPTLGSMFKSQNGGTWDAEQNEDVKFDLKIALFQETTAGTITLVNDEVPVKTLQQNPLTTTSGSADIIVHHPNHGMHSTAANVIIAGVPSGTLNGIASTNINGTYTTIKDIKLDSYVITAQNSDVASASGDVGGTTVTATRNILFDVIQPVIGAMQLPETSLLARIRTTGGRTLEGSETEYSLATSSKSVPIIINADQYMTSPGMVASSINETNEMSGSKSLVLTLEMETFTQTLSPVIDLKRLSAHLIQNRLNNPTSGTTPDFVAETTNIGGSSAAKYITRPVQLTNPSTALDIRISANVRSTSAVKMFFRVSSAEDARKLGDVVWTAFNDDGLPDSAVTATENDSVFKEHQYSASDIPAFAVFQLKVVLTGTNSSYPPIIKDMRGIALAV